MTLVKQGIKVVQFLYQIEKNTLLKHLDKYGQKGNNFVIEKLASQNSKGDNKLSTLISEESSSIILNRNLKKKTCTFLNLSEMNKIA